MAYRDRTTMSMSPLATKWHDMVKTRALAIKPDADVHSKPTTKWQDNFQPEAVVEGPGLVTTQLMLLFEAAQGAILKNLFRNQIRCSLSADYFQWNVAKAVWDELSNDLFCPDSEPFPYETEKPATYGTPYCEQRKDHGELVCRYDPSPGPWRRALAFPIPRVRQLHLCVGTMEKMQDTMNHAASILGPEFTLSCSFGGNDRATITLGLAPGVDSNNEYVIARARNPIDWLEDWFLHVLQSNTNLVEHLQLLSRQRFVRSEGYDTKTRKSIIGYWEQKVTHMSEEDLAMAFQSQQEQLDCLAAEFANSAVKGASSVDGLARFLVEFVEDEEHFTDHMFNREDRLRCSQTLAHPIAVDSVRRMIFAPLADLSGLIERLDGFVRYGSANAPYNDDKHTRLSVLQDAWSSATTEVDDLLTLWKEELQRGDRDDGKGASLLLRNPNVGSCIGSIVG
ncbi:hypothetical protein PG996_013521 [Apiospora saccharicola]|uniref:Uncharacterized protein n=1 Tax=Apiospora saccharicola TaxID=335842 RepID=A0ABR1U5Q2_9PEZI